MSNLEILEQNEVKTTPLLKCKSGEDDCFSESKLSNAKNQDERSRAFACIAYSELSVYAITRECKSRFIPCMVSPMHTPANNSFHDEEETESKPHWHIVFIMPSGKVMHRATAIRISRDIGNGTISFPVAHIGKYVRYLTHLDHPEKEQFSEPPKLYCLSKEEYTAYVSATEDEALTDILDLIDQNGIKSITTLIRFIRQTNPSLIKKCIKYTYFYQIYMKGIE